MAESSVSGQGPLSGDGVPRRVVFPEGMSFFLDHIPCIPPSEMRTDKEDMDPDSCPCLFLLK